MVRTLPLTLLLSWLVWQRGCTCTKSSGQFASISWEAARAAAKATHQQNLRLAGLGGDASSQTPPALPGEHVNPTPAAEKGPSAAMHGPASVQTCRDTSSVPHGGPTVNEAKFEQYGASGTPQPTVFALESTPVTIQHQATEARTAATLVTAAQHSWKAARVAVNGIRGRASPTIPPALPGCVDKGPSDPLHGPGSVQLRENAFVVPHGEARTAADVVTAVEPNGTVTPQHLATEARTAATLVTAVRHSWEAAQVAVKAAYQRNSRLAGIRGRASPSIPPALPGGVDKGPSDPLHGPGSVQVRENVAVVSHGEARTAADVVTAVELNGTAKAAPAAGAGQQTVAGPRGWSLLLTHIVCFLLGWLLRGSTLQHRAQVPDDGSDLADSTKVSKSTGVSASSDSCRGSQQYCCPAAAPAGVICQQPGPNIRQNGVSSRQKQQHKRGDDTPMHPMPNMAQVLSEAGVVAEVQAVTSAAMSSDETDRSCGNKSYGLAVSADDKSMQLQRLSSQRHNKKTGKPSRKVVLLHYRRSKTGCTNGKAAGGQECNTTISQGLMWQGQEQQQAASRASSAGSLIRVQTTQPGQHPLQVVITARPETVNALVVPALRILQQVAAGVQTLSLMSAGVVHHAQQLSSGITDLTSRMDNLLGWARKQDHQQQLAAQQVLGHNAAQLGLSLLLLAVGVAALRVGRVWEVHKVCVDRSQGYIGSWQQRLTGTRHATSAWLYASCCAQELGLYAAGLGVLYWLAKASWMGLMSSSRDRGNHTSKSWLLDVLVLKGFVCAVAGAHIMHCLGAAWVPWLGLWWLWCSMQAMLQTRVRRTATRFLLVVTVSLMLPFAMALAPFHAGGILLQGWLIQALPVLGRLPNLRQLLPAW